MTHTIEITVQDEQLSKVLALLEQLKQQGIRIEVDPDDRDGYYQSVASTLTEWESQEDEYAFQNL